MGMVFPKKVIDKRVKKTEINIETKPNLEIHEGHVSQKEETLPVKQGGKTVAIISLSEPVMVVQAEQEEEWGYYQFPSIGKANDGTLIVGWQMNADSHKSYGKVSERKRIPMMSKDKGKTWKKRDKNYNELRGVNKTRLKDGRILTILTPASKDIKSYKTFPKPVGQKGNMSFYFVDDLPTELQGVYIQKGEESIHGKIIDNGLLRYSIDGSMPITWWGNIKELSDGSMVAGIYPCYYLNEIGEVSPSQIRFYKSTDGGHNWLLLGKVPFKNSIQLPKNNWVNKNGDYEEPTFEVLSDGTYVCVMRTGMVSPMLESFSYDEGKTWSEPKEISPNGVDPSLKLLKNGVLTLVSGRPGIQIRFSLDGTGRNWTEPIDMMPFMKEDGSYEMNVSCGYPAIIEDSKNSFLIVYSDFNTKNNNDETRKAILIRRVEVKKKSM
jgi:hypothetical protein